MVYVIVFQEGRMLRGKIMRICDSFMGRNVEIPNNANVIKDIQDRINDLAVRTEEAKKLIFFTRSRLRLYLLEV